MSEWVAERNTGGWKSRILYGALQNVKEGNGAIVAHEGVCVSVFGCYFIHSIQ